MIDFPVCSATADRVGELQHDIFSVACGNNLTLRSCPSYLARAGERKGIEPADLQKLNYCRASLL
jgi:hypothetical protein